MSDLLTHWAVFEDCRRLAPHDAAIDPLFAHLMQDQRDSARLGALSRGGRAWVPLTLRRTRKLWPTLPDPASTLGRRLAFALGGITHFAADLVMKPMLKRHATPGAPKKQEKREVSAYYDVHVFREVYLAGQEEPFSRFLLAANTTAPGQALEDFVRALFQRALLSSHTLSPDSADFDTWFDRFDDLVQPLYIDVDLYVRVFTRPDEAKIRQYGVETEFYLKTDPAVRVARAIQSGQPLPQPDLDAAFAEHANRGGYGQSLALAMRTLRQASAFWQGKTDTPPDVSQGD